MKIYNIYEVQHKNPEIFGPHTHQYHELVYCIKGNGSAEIHGKRKPFRTGNYYVTHAGTKHTEYDDFPCQIVYFYFSSPHEKVIEGIYTDYNGAVLSVIQRLLLESQNRFSETTEMQNCLLQQILILVRRLASGEINQDMAAILQYVHEHSEQEIDFRQLAAKQNYSYDRFRHLFQEYTGMPPHQYVLMKRLEKARFLIELDTRASLSELSLKCGFASSSQFTNIFRSKMGMTPSEYRKRLRNR